MDTNEYTAAVRRALRAKGFKGSVHHGSGTAYCWVHIRGTGEYHEFTPQENALLVSLGFPTGGNLALISDRERVRYARTLGFEFSWNPQS